MTQCMTPSCTRPSSPALKRGLCLVCYSKARKMIDAGSTTWEEVVSLGLALPTEDGTELFTAELLKRRTNAGNQPPSAT